MRDFIESVRWMAVAWAVIWISAFAVAEVFPSETGLLHTFIGLGISASILLLRE